MYFPQQQNQCMKQTKKKKIKKNRTTQQIDVIKTPQKVCIRKLGVQEFIYKHLMKSNILGSRNTLYL